MSKYTHAIIIALLAIILLITGVGLYLVSVQLADLNRTLQATNLNGAEYGPPPNVAQNDCVLSGGEYQNNVCYCGKDYQLENGMCMGMDGLTKKELEEVKAGQERLMKQTSHFDSAAVGVIFDYPKGWVVEEYGYGDSDVPEMRNAVKLTSSRGVLESAVSAGGPICQTETCFSTGMQMDIRPLSAEFSRDLRSGTLTKVPTVYPGISSISGCDGAGCPSQWHIFSCPNGDREIRITYSDASYAEIADDVLKSFSAYCQ